MIKKLSIILASIVLLSACETGAIKSETVKVYKFDGSVSCDQSSGTSIENMRLELMKRKIPIISANCGTDGLVRAAVCGIDTGRVNVFEIRTDVYSSAIALGYQLVTKLEDYSAVACK
jgi:hypothetical protein